MIKRPLSYYVALLDWQRADDMFHYEPERVRERLKAVRRAGLRWIAIHGVNLMQCHKAPLDEAVRRTAGELERDGISVSSFHYLGPTYAPVDEDQSFVQELLRRSVEQFRHWRPKAMVVHPGILRLTGASAGANWLSPTHQWKQFNEECRRHGLDTVRATVAANLRVMAEAAAPHGINIAVENLGNMPLLGAQKEALYFSRENLTTREDLEYFDREIQLPNFGFCVDSGHAHISDELTQDWIRFAGKRLFETHFHDNYGSQGLKLGPDAPEAWMKLDRHLSPGFGTIDWREVMRALDDVAFPGPITFETNGWPNADPAIGYQRAMEWWETCVEIAYSAKH